MEGKKQGGSSSFPSDLFGTKESSSSKGVFGSVFPPASKMVGKDSLESELLGSLRKQDSRNDVWNNKQGAPATKIHPRLIICIVKSPYDLLNYGVYLFQIEMLKAEKVITVAYPTRNGIPFIRMSQLDHAISALLSTMVDKTSILIPLVPGHHQDLPLFTSKMGEVIQMKTIYTVLQEAIGGKVHSITKTLSNTC